VQVVVYVSRVDCKKEALVILKKKVLAVNDLIAKELEISNYLYLFPTLRSELPWAIKMSEYRIINSFITVNASKTTDMLIDIGMIDSLASPEALRKLIRPNVSLIFYIVLYRFLRIMRLLEDYSPQTLLLIDTQEFSPPSSIQDLYNLTRDSWEFNQYVINKILFDVEKIKTKDKEVFYPDGYWDFARWTNYDGFKGNAELLSSPNKIKTIINSPAKALVSKTHEIIEKLSSRGYQVPVLALGYNERFLFKAGLFWPRGKFCKLPQKLPVPAVSPNCNDLLRNDYSSQTKSYFRELLIQFLSLMNYDVESSAMKYIDNISNLFFNMYPITMFEQAEELSAWSISEISKYKIKHYFTGNTGTSDVGIYFNHAASENKFKTWSQQHSAWGGYIANVPNIAEVSIAGSDNYITSGWTHCEPHLPFWKDSAVPLSSPHYSELAKIVVKKENNNNNSVLLLTGQVFNFPIYPAGTHEVDVLLIWAEAILDVIQNLARKGIQILLKNYAPRVESMLENYGILEEWIKAGGNKITLLEANKKGTASQYFKDVSATIWDIPSGGFVESIMSGLPAFSLWNDSLIRCQPESADEINQLLSVGIFNSDGKSMADNVASCLTDSNWLKSTKRQESIDQFLSHYVKTNSDWQAEWKLLLEPLN
jgi:hypothetical protein